MQNTLTTPEVVAVAGLTGVYVRTISGKDYKRFQSACRASNLPDGEKETDTVYRFVNLSACSEDGRRLWTDDQLEDTEAVSITRAKAIYAAAAELNGLAEKKSS